MTSLANLAPRRLTLAPLHVSRGETLSAPLWQPEPVAPRAAYPEPEFRARAVDVAVVPSAPRSFVRLITEQDEEFFYDVREARGWIPDARTGEPKSLVSSVSVRVRCARGRLALVWVEGRIDTALAAMPKRGLFPTTLAQAKDFVRGAEIMYIPKKKYETKKSTSKNKEGMR